MQLELQEINDVIKNIANFMQENETVKPDFEEYLKTIGNSMNPQAAYFNYIFERYLNQKSIPQLYIESAGKISATSKKITESLSKSISSIASFSALARSFAISGSNSSFISTPMITCLDYSIISQIQGFSINISLEYNQYLLFHLVQKEEHFLRC